MLPARTSSCPTDLDLEAHLQVPDLRVQAHAAGCRHCGGWISAARAEGERFEREVSPYLLPRIVRALKEEEERPRGWLTRLRPLVLAGSLAAVAASAGLVFLAESAPVPGDPEPIRLPAIGQIKGAGGSVPAGLQVVLRHGEEVRAAFDGQAVAPGDALRFTVLPPGPRFVTVLSLDGSGKVSRLHVGDEPIALPTTLPGSVVLDDAAGPEHVFVIFSRTRLPWSDLERAAREALPVASPEAVRALRTLPIRGTEQSSVVLERRP